MVKHNLTAKEQMFIKEYLIDLNATQASIRAGYSKKTAGVIGYENLKKPHIQNALKVAIDERNTKVDIKAEYVLNCLKEVVERCMQKKLVPGSKKEGEAGVWQFDSAGANKALRSLGEHLGLFNLAYTNPSPNPLPANPVVFYIPDNGRIKANHA